MQECRDPDQNKRPTAADIGKELNDMYDVEYFNPTEIIISPDIGPIATNDSEAIYSSRPLSGMINSAMSIRTLKSQSITFELGKYFKH